MDFAKGAGEIVGVVEAGLKGGFGDIHLALSKKDEAAGNALAQEDLVQSGLRGLGMSLRAIKR